MSISSVLGVQSAAREAERVSLVLNKVADVRKTEAQALVSLISQATEVAAAPAGGGGVGSLVSYYA